MFFLSTSMLAAFDGLLWLVLMLLPLVILQRLLHREIQVSFLLLTRRPGVTQVMFALLFFPGVVLHEFSHFIMAKILGMKTRGFSLIPRATDDGRLVLGYVELVSGGTVRDALVGIAPLISGSLFVAYVATVYLRMPMLWDFVRAGYWELFWQGIGILPTLSNFWLWFYLTFTVSSTMLPSSADRHAWTPLVIGVGVLLVLAVLAGAGPWMLANLAPPVNTFLKSLAAIFGLSAGFHLLLLLPFALLHRILTRLTGLDVGE